MKKEPPASLRWLVERFDPWTFDAPEGRARIRCTDTDAADSWDVVIRGGSARLVPAQPGKRPDASMEANGATWSGIARRASSGLAAFRTGALVVRHNLHLAVGLLVATTGSDDPGRMRFMRVGTDMGPIATFQAGIGAPVVLLHGLGATKGSMLPLVSRLVGSHRVIGMDLPGFGDSVKPLGAAYDAAFFARSVVALLNALGIDRAHLVGHSLGGRVAIEVGLDHRSRVDRLVLLTPSLAWLRERRWAAYVRLLRPELGVVSLVPHEWTDALVRRLVPGSSSPWAAIALDEFLRAYRTPRGRAAFYAAARQIYLEEPNGPGGFWSRLATLEPPSLFVFGRRDRLVPVAFGPHVRRALPSAQLLKLDTGHVPQLERPEELSSAILRFLAGERPSAERPPGGSLRGSRR